MHDILDCFRHCDVIHLSSNWQLKLWRRRAHY